MTAVSVLKRRQSGNIPSSQSTESKMAELTTAKGKTRGRNPRDIEYQKFDLEKPDTLPKTLAEFMETTGIKDQKELLAFTVDGFNSYQYSLASDEIGEFINDAWDKDTQAQFRLVVRNQAKLMNSSIEDVANMLLPAINKAWEAKQAAKALAEANKPTETATA